MEELRALVELIERLHAGPDRPFHEWTEEEMATSEIHLCEPFMEGVACCLERVRSSPEFEAARRALG